jgi:hypothetical protein
LIRRRLLILSNRKVIYLIESLRLLLYLTVRKGRIIRYSSSYKKGCNLVKKEESIKRNLFTLVLHKAEILIVTLFFDKV